LKSSRNRSIFSSRAAYASAALGAVCAVGFCARAELAPWLQTVVSGSTIEAALYRVMDLPGVKMLYPRPPAEARSELGDLLKGKSDAAQLYALRAHSEEQALDFSVAEQDWKSFVTHTDNKQAAEFELADFYHRRLEGPQEIAALEEAASAPPATGEKFLAADKQQAWCAFTRALTVAQEQALGDDASTAIYKAWIAHYPAEPAAWAAFISILMDMHRYSDAQQAIADYHTAFPQDEVFPIKATALVALQQGDTTATRQALALFDKAYQPLWPAELVQTYFQLLKATHTEHTMLADTRARLLQNPDDYSAATRIFFYYQQQGRSDAAVNTLAEYGASKESRHVAWTADELYTFAVLLDNASQDEEAARYYYALAGTQGRLTGTTQTPEEAGLCNIIRLLLSSPEKPIDLGSENLSIYRDLATLDQGPGYLNGILSLWFNSATPPAEFHDEEVKATPYFHRAKAAELLAVLDQRFPASSARPALHAALIRAYITYGQDDAVRKAGQQFLTDFPHTPERIDVALEVADVDARQKDTKAEFALYEGLLSELSASLQGMPLSAAGTTTTPEPQAPAPGEEQADNGSDTSAQTTTAPATQASALLKQSLSIPVFAPATAATSASYRQILERYLGRLTTEKQLPAALAVLRRELDRNPNDPLLYARLADFLQQNNLASEQEAVYQQAIARFNDMSFYDKLARFYLREKRQQDFDSLTHKVVDIFQGTELEIYFGKVSGSWSQEYVELNLYAHKRFPHDLTFTYNLLRAYHSKDTYDTVAWEQLMREHWHEAPDLQTEFFEYLSQSGKLDSEIAALQTLVPAAPAQQQNPAATRELAQLQLWQSHFEESAPLLGSLADMYPADTAVGEEAASVFRSLAYYDPAQILRAVTIEKHLSDADPANLDRLATIGDIYADSTAASLNLSADHQIALAAPYWKRMSAVHPGLSNGYLQSATVFWDYFQFDDAIAQIEAARRQFRNPALFGYEAGAVYENKRDYPHAIAEYVRAATATESQSPRIQQDEQPTDEGVSETPDSEARERLLELATRPATGELVDQATASSLEQHPTLAALELRVDVLNARQQKNAIGPAVEMAIQKVTSAEDAAQLAELSQNNQLTKAYQLALQREIALSIDPVQRIELQYQLAIAYEDQKDTAGAQRVIEAVYKDNAKILGVVRRTTDFYWNNKQPQRAVATLVQAAHDANPGLAHDFTLEAAAKSSQSGDYAGARTLLKPLLDSDPYNEQYLHLYADSYAQAHDAAGVRDFYAATLTSLQNSKLSRLDKRDKIALARQGLIAALTDLKDYSGGLDQHIALISAFPEDSNILQNAASYARLHGREQQLVAFLNKTVTDSPQDSRFAIDLGRVDVLFEDYDGALAAYSKAIAIRKDRPELYIARADLEEHQQSFDAVCADYERLYFLTYKDPQWMEKAALARARQGRVDLAVKALQTAWIEGHAPSAENNFRVAKQLADWDMLTEARSFADQGVKLAGNDLLTNSAFAEGAVQYAGLLGRQRQAQQAFDLLEHARAAANMSPSSPSIVIKQVEEKGIAAVTNSEWRQQLVEMRRRTAQNNFERAVRELSTTVATFYTPEEKAAYAHLLDTKRANASSQELVNLWIPAAEAAGLKDREASWRRDVLLSGDKDYTAQQLQAFDTLEAERMDNLFRAQTLDAYAATLPYKNQLSALSMAASAWRDAGDVTAETRDLRKLVISHQATGHQQRLFEILLQHNPSALLTLAAAKGNYADPAADYAVANGSKAFAYQMVAARAAANPPVWANATNALLGLYFADTSPRTDSAFQAALANGSIGERLRAKPDEDTQIMDDPWFYYAMRYGVLRTLALKPNADPEDYLPAGLELKPQNSESYTGLAQAYLDAHRYDAAITEYRHVEELDPTDPAPNLSIAEVLWTEGHHDEALTEWNTALTKMLAMIGERSVPESFWTCFADLANDARSHQIGGKLKPGMNTVLETYIRKNGSYRSVELLHSAYTALGEQKDAIDWVLALAADTKDQRSILSDLLEQRWFPRSLAGNLYRQELILAEAEVQASSAKTTGSEDGSAQEDSEESELTSIQLRYLNWLLRQGQIETAQRLLDSIPAEQRQSTEMQTITLLLAAQESRLPQLLAGYQDNPENAPELETLSSVANQLRLKKDNANSRVLLEYVFQQKTALQELASTDYLALAEARLATSDVPGALDLLHRLTLQGDLYENLDSAAALLMETGHVVEALPLLAKLANGTPWNHDYRRRLGEAQLAIKQDAAADSLNAVTASDNAPYDVRAKAAEALHTVPGTRNFSSAELTMLASAAPGTRQANQPYFVYARMRAAEALPAAQRADLLHAALMEAPASLHNTLRLGIFTAEVAANHYEQADVAVTRLLSTNPALRRAPSEDGEDDSSEEAEAQQDYADSEETQTPAVFAQPEDRLNFLLALATMEEHIREESQAIEDLQTAARLTDDKVQRSKLESHASELQDLLTVRMENSTRRPVIHKSIEQTGLVRPRLMARTAKVQP
jgi:cellulose synthase operon protein C